MEEKRYYSTPEVNVNFFDEKDVLTYSGEAGGLGDEVFEPGNEYGNSWW